jgi:hypothetical protein
MATTRFFPSDHAALCKQIANTDRFTIIIITTTIDAEHDAEHVVAA